MRKILSILLVLLLVSRGLVLAEAEGVKVRLNNEELPLDVEAITIKDSPLLPIRGVLEALGFKVTWDGKTSTVMAEKEGTLINIPIHGDSGKVNGKVVELNSPVVVRKERTFIDLKFIEEAAEAKITWDEKAKVVSITKAYPEEEYKTSLTYSNLLDKKSQDETRKAMEKSGIPKEDIDFFFEELNEYNETIEGKSLVEEGFVTIDSLEPEYDLVAIEELWQARYPYFLGYNCRIITYDLMKDSIHIGKIQRGNSDWIVFDKNALEYNPKEVFTQKEQEEFETFYSYIPTELTKDIDVHLENVKEDWKAKEIKFSNEDKRTIISVFFHTEENQLFIGHMGLLIPGEDGKLLFIEKLSFLEPYQAIKFSNRTELNDYLMNKYDISWGQETAKPFILENGELLEGYREKPSNM